MDADGSREESSIYRLIVNGRDNGVSPLFSTTIVRFRLSIIYHPQSPPPPSTDLPHSFSQVQIRAENRNDEYPIFLPTSSYISYVAEDAKEGTPIIEIQAKDIDGDQVRGNEERDNIKYSLDTLLPIG